MDEREKILKSSFSEGFVNKMKNAIEMSHYKYGPAKKTYPELCKAYENIVPRLELYLKDHNTEHLVDVANFAMLEFMFPSFPDSAYKGTDSSESPGLVGGVSYNEMIAEAEGSRSFYDHVKRGFK